jgi:hypothetical protein
MDMQQKIECLFAGQEETKEKIKADVKAWYEMRERGEAERKVYMEKLFAKWKAYREGIVTRGEAIRDKIDDKSWTNWAKLDTDLKKKKADILKAYEEKRMAKRKADQERREAYKKMMAERKADQERWEAERKAYEEKMMAKWKVDQETREAESLRGEDDGQAES